MPARRQANEKHAAIRCTGRRTGTPHAVQVVDGDTFGAAFRYNEPLKEFVK